MPILVTGGAGYIGSHVVRLLRDRGDRVIIVDNLATGKPARIGDATIVDVDIAARDATAELAQIIADQDVTAVIHLAAKKQAGESVTNPVLYYRENLGGLANLLAAIEGSKIDRFVFSSSAAVYGNPPTPLVTEDTELHPINPYGETKLAGEWLVRATARACGFKAINLRYFNVAGAGWDDLGDLEPLNLLTIAIDAIARGRRPVIFGDDFATPDGTGVRDYVHVMDLATAHLVALDALATRTPAHDVFNVGTGRGASVREILTELERTSGLRVDPVVGQRRAGDPAAVVADVTRVNGELGWSAELGVAEIVASAWQAHQTASVTPRAS